MKKALGLLVVVVVVLGIALGWRISSGRAYKHAASGGSGVVEATEVDLSARIAAPIVAIHVREGDRVTKGQVLVELDCAEPVAAVDESKARLAMALAAVDAAKATEAAAAGNTSAAWQSARASAAQAQAMEAERSFAMKESYRLVSLHHEGVISDSVLDTTETRVTSVQRQEEALLASTRAATAMASAAERSRKAAAAQTIAAEHGVRAAEAVVRRSSVLVGECTVKSPINGVVLHRNFEPGELALPGSRLVTIVDLQDAKATFYLRNAELASAEAGRAVEIRADAWPDEVFPGTILRVAAKAEFTPRNVQTREDRDRLVYAVEIAIPNIDERLRPGMPIEVSIAGTER